MRKLLILGLFVVSCASVPNFPDAYGLTTPNQKYAAQHLRSLYIQSLDMAPDQEVALHNDLRMTGRCLFHEFEESSGDVEAAKAHFVEVDQKIKESVFNTSEKVLIFKAFEDRGMWSGPASLRCKSIPYFLADR